MAEEGPRYKLNIPHFLEGDRYVEAGAIVGHGTMFPVRQPTLEMEPLNDAAKREIEKEEERLSVANATMNPEENIPDDYDERYVPGFNRKRKGAE